MRQAVGGGCQSGWGRLLSVSNGVRGTVGGQRLGTLEGGGGGYTSTSSNASLAQTCATAQCGAV